ncbi:uncharacterized protein ARMOST_19064 [Armillaria ostoyae]|uniref:Uncharacterized protein n=1 Tax=Armillaria ostoyae TaxID=47428 RepID=A0A284S3H1_ARMOS|nr:uncharacterized protein ARMOST_19064 [Armillaria ostoyae]
MTLPTAAVMANTTYKVLRLAVCYTRRLMRDTCIDNAYKNEKLRKCVSPAHTALVARMASRF